MISSDSWEPDFTLLPCMYQLAKDMKPLQSSKPMNKIHREKLHQQHITKAAKEIGKC